MKTLHTSKRKTIQAFILAVALLLTATPFSMAEDLGVVTGGGLHLRAKPSTDAEILGTYGSGTHLRVMGVDGTWYHVEISNDGMTGYMEAAFIYITNRGVVENGNEYVNLRSGPSREAKVLGRFQSGTPVTVLSENDSGWLHVEADGMTGYMDAAFVQAAPEEATPRPIATGDAKEATDVYHLSMDGSNGVAQEIGQARTKSGTDGGLTYSITYPVLGKKAADDALLAWVDSTLDDARDLAQDNASTTLSLSVQFDSFLAGGRYMGVLETGYLDGSMLAHSADLVFVINVDEETGKVITYKEIFTDNTDAVAALVRDKLTQLEGNPVDGVEVDESWLSHALLMPHGVLVVLPRSEYLAGALGTQGVLLRYEDLQAQGLLALDVEGDPLFVFAPFTDPATQAVGSTAYRRGYTL